jgi:hypothetical protein
MNPPLCTLISYFFWGGTRPWPLLLSIPHTDMVTSCGPRLHTKVVCVCIELSYIYKLSNERTRELRKEGRVVPSRVKLRSEVNLQTALFLRSLVVRPLVSELANTDDGLSA